MTVNPRQHYRKANLAVRCWCELTIVSVPAADVRRGLTRPCDSEHCRRLDDRRRRDEG